MTANDCCHAQAFTVATTGTYDTSSAQDCDGLLELTDSAFDPSNAGTCPLASNDDRPDVNESYVSCALVPGTTSTADSVSAGTITSTSAITGLLSGSNALTLHAHDNTGDKSAGVARSVTYTPTRPTDAADAIEDPINSAYGLDLKAGRARGHTQPLEDALRNLEKNHTEDACNQLRDFVTKVEAKTPAPVQPGDDSVLINAANDIRGSVGCTD